MECFGFDISDRTGTT